MTMTDARSPIRALRAALFAAVCIALAATGHSFISAHDIPIPALLTAFAATTAVGWFAGGRRHGLPAIGTGLLAVQGALHLIFSGAGRHPSRHHHAEPATTAVGPMDVDAGMLAAHLVAAAVCALWLARGEAAFFRLAHAVGHLAFTPLRLLLTLVLPPAAPRPVPQSPRPRRLHGVHLAHALTRRGPPAFPAPLATAPGAAA
ncbi:hypothetical protein ACH492_17880 [Streptomyces sp. NPDC019443]|uniref:hypothetical protein n=1 Tax=Streptomyces sp. NPDC019443 TaxID=3365061 RepID=UPI00379061EC